MLLPNKLYAEWKKDAAWQLVGQTPVDDYPVSLTVIFYVKDNKSRDMDNMLGAIMDILQQAGVLANDDWKHVDTITLQFGGVDKLQPRTEIWIDES